MTKPKKYLVEFVGSIQARWSIEIESTSYSQAEEDARRCLPDSSLAWSLGDGTNQVIDVELVDCTLLGAEAPDRDLGRLALEAKYTPDEEWGEHPVYVRIDWRTDVVNEDTQSSYWDWVYNSLQNEGDV